MICFAVLCWPCLLTPLNYFLFRPWSIIGSGCKCFCSITRWIPNMALGNQATVYATLLGYNFLRVVMIFNSKWLFGSQPKLTTVSRTRKAWCMSGNIEAGRLYLAAMVPSKRRVLRLDLTFLLDWKKWVWVSEFLQGEGCCWCPEVGACLCFAVAHCFCKSGEFFSQNT